MLQQLDDPPFRSYRDGDDEEVDAGLSRERHQFGNRAELRIAGNDRRRPVILAVVEDAANADVLVRLGREREDQFFRRGAAADDDSAALEQAGPRPGANPGRDDGAKRDDCDEPEDEPDEEPAAGEVVARAREKGAHRKGREHDKPVHQNPPEPRREPAQCDNPVGPADLGEEDVEQPGADRGDGVGQRQPVLRLDHREKNQIPAARHQNCLGHAHASAHDHA